MTVNSILGTLLSALGLRKEQSIRKSVPEGCLCVFDASSAFRKIANKYVQRIGDKTVSVPVSAMLIFQELDSFFMPYVQAAAVRKASAGQKRTSDDDDEDYCDAELVLPFLLVMDDRANYPIQRKIFLEETRHEGDEQYETLAHLFEDTFASIIDLKKLLDTKIGVEGGGHTTLMRHYIQHTRLSFILLPNNVDPAIFVNTTVKPALFKHPMLGVKSFDLQPAPFCHLNGGQLLQLPLEYPRYGSATPYTPISECDMKNVWLLLLNIRSNPNQPTCNIAKDGDCLFTQALQGLSSALHVWPETKKTVISFDMKQFVGRIPAEVWPSIAMCVYMGGSDFGHPVPLFTAPALISATLGLFLGGYFIPEEVAQDRQKLQKQKDALKTIYSNMTFINPTTWKFDELKFKALLQGLMALKPMYYLSTKTKSTETQNKKEMSDMHVLAYNKGGISLGKMAVLNGSKYSLVAGQTKAWMLTKLNAKGKPREPDEMADTKARVAKTLKAAYEASAHFAQRDLIALDFVDFSLIGAER